MERNGLKKHLCGNAHTSNTSVVLWGQILVKQAEEAVVISHCMLNSRNSTGAGVGNNLSSQCGGGKHRQAICDPGCTIISAAWIQE